MSNNSFISNMEKIVQMNKNSVELLTKLNDISTSSENAITVTRENATGDISQYQIPTVNGLKVDIENLKNTIKSMTDPTTTSYIVDGASTKKFFSMDLKREPTTITNLNLVDTFKTKTNWFFESLMNPLLSVSLDLNDKIDNNINKVLTRRYIVNFAKNPDGTYTKEGSNSLNLFRDKFLNKNEFSIVDFETWFLDTNNTGVINQDNIEDIIDEDVYEINFKTLNARGYFTVLKMEVDDVNNKIWYHLNTPYFEKRDGTLISLQEGDEVILATKENNSRFEIIETSNKDNTFKIILNRVEGFDPVPVGENMLEYYSSISNNRYAEINVGYDEYNVIFIKSINTETYISSSIWSKGVSFYTNDLNLVDDSTVTLNDYYESFVNDYGKVLQDMAALYIPSSYSTTPTAPTLNVNNFKVVQTNKHLTDNENTDKLGKLHSKKIATKTKVEQISKAIEVLNNEINNTTFSSVVDKDSSYASLNSLYNQLEAETKTYNTLVQNINSLKFENTEDPAYSVRGFWEIPEAITTEGVTQDIVKFIVQYRHTSKGSDANSTEGFSLDNFKSSDGSVISTGYYANWNEIETSVRNRSFDATVNKWVWATEDLTSADENNINSLNIPLKDHEKVEVRVKSTSSVGFPITEIYSEWSDTMTIEFPDSLSTSNSFVDIALNEAAKEDVIIQMNNDLTGKGIFRHSRDSYTNNDVYVSHKDTEIVSSFKDNNSNSMMLVDYLKYLTGKITELETKVNKIKGELLVTLVKGNDSVIIRNNSTKYVTIECEDYGTPESTTSFRQFKNELYIINDYKLVFTNVSTTENLSYLTTNNYEASKPYFNNTAGAGGVLDTNIRPYFVNTNNVLKEQKDNQLLYICDTDLKGENITTDITTAANHTTKNLGLPSGVTSNIKDSIMWKESGDYLQTVVIPVVDNIDNLISSSGDYQLKPKYDIQIPLNIYFRFTGKIVQDPENINRTTTFTVDSGLSKDFVTRTIRFYTQSGSDAEVFTFNVEFKINKFKDAIFVSPPLLDTNPIKEDPATDKITILDNNYDEYIPEIIQDDVYDFYKDRHKDTIYDNYWDIYNDDWERRYKWDRFDTEPSEYK